MVTKIARKEFIDLVRDGRFRLTASIVLVLLLLSLVAGWQHHRKTRAEQEAAQHDAREVWLNQGAKDPHNAAHFGTYAYRPQLLPAFVDQGLNDYLGVAIFLEAHRQNSADFRPAQDGSASQRFGQLTAATVLQLLIPLLIILLTFAAFAGEREQGTLRLVLSQGVRRGDLGLGKALGVSAALGLILIPAALLGAAALAFGSADSFSLSLPRLLLMSVVYLLYFVIILALALGTSAIAPSSTFALILLLGFWIGNSIVAPRAAADLSKLIVPTPSQTQIAAAIEFDTSHGIDGNAPPAKRFAELRERVLLQYGVQRLEDLPINFSGISLQAGEDYADLIQDKNYQTLRDSYERQTRIQQKAALVAPMLAVRSLSMSMAGSDFKHHQHFAAAAESYRREMIRVLNERLTLDYKRGEETIANRNLWQRIPDFSYQPPDSAWAFTTQWLSGALLLLWGGMSVLFAAFAINRLRVE